MKRPVLYIIIPFCAGIASAGHLNITLPVSLAAGLIFSAASFVSSSKKTLSHAALYLAVFSLGVSCHLNANITQPRNIVNMIPEDAQALKAVVKGTIEDDPSVEDAFFGAKKISFLLKAEAVKRGGDWQASEGLARVYVYTSKGRLFGFADEVVLEGAISRPVGLKNPGLFDYARYLANNGIYCVLRVNDKNLIQVMRGSPANPVKRAAYRIRGIMRSALDRYLDGADAALAKAMLIGDRSGLGNDINDEFIKTGTVHILSISGLHVGLIAALVLFVFGILRVPKKVNLIMTVVFLIVYSYVAGSSPPIIRAVVMFAVFAMGYVMGRNSDLLNSLALAALFILLPKPKQIFDPGFQLSFVSIASICVFAPKIENLLKTGRFKGRSARDKAGRYILGGISVSVAAWIGTWPIISSYFNIISPVSVLANLIVIPLSFVSMIFATAVICASFISPLASSAIAFFMSRFDAILFAANRIMSDLPLAYFRTPAVPAAAMFLYYLLVLLWAMPSDYIEAGFVKIRKTRIAVIALLILNITVWTGCLSGRDGALKATFLDVGSGDSAFVEFPGGGNFLIDAGSGGEEGRFDAGRNVVAPYIWNEGARFVGALFITHNHEDHLGGAIYILNNFKVGAVFDSGPGKGGRLYEEYLKSLKRSGAKRIVVGAGDSVIFPDGSRIYLLSPEDPDAQTDTNEGSLVGKFVYEGKSVLFTGDASGEALEKMIDSYGNFLRSDIMKAPHHGGDIGSVLLADKFFQAVSPDVVIVSSKASRRKAGNGKNSLTRLHAREYDTGRDGAIILHIKRSICKITRFINHT